MENNTQGNQEIDLIFLFQKIKEFFFNIGLFIYRIINFIKKNFFILLSLLIIGIGAGYLVEKKGLVINRSELMVVPNFGSTEYIYNEIDVINQSKSKIPELKNLVKIEVEPIYEVKDIFLDKEGNEKNQEFLKSYFENSNKIQKEMLNDKLKSFYKNHLITVETKNVKDSKSIIDYIINRLNNNEYFLAKGKNEQKILQEKEIELKQSIVQINDILNKLGKTENVNTNDKGVNINTYNEIGKMLEQKNTFIADLSSVKNSLVTSNFTVYTYNKSINIDKQKKLQNNYMFLFPIVLMFLFFSYKTYSYLRKKYHDFV
ncbi:hypothetical protein OBK30_12195 [Empedobacter falsenii]